MSDLVSRNQLEGVDQSGEKSRLAVIQAALGIDRNKNIVVQMLRIGICCFPVVGIFIAVVDHVKRIKDQPRSWSEKILARDFGKCVDERFGLKICHRAELFSVVAAYRV